MASVTIESAFVESWTKNQEQHPAWGMRTAEQHRRKNDQGQYETVGRTFRTIKVSRSSGIDLTQFAKGDRVKVTGSEVTESREYEGKTYYDLIVWADSVELVQAGQRQVQQAPTTDSWSTPGRSGDEPF